MTRRTALQILAAVQDDAPESEPGGWEERAYKQGARDLLVAITAAGAFEDGRNVADALGLDLADPDVARLMRLGTERAR